MGQLSLPDLAPVPGLLSEDATTLLLSSLGWNWPSGWRVWLTTPAGTRPWDSSPTSQGSLGIVQEVALPGSLRSSSLVEKQLRLTIA